MKNKKSVKMFLVILLVILIAVVFGVSGFYFGTKLSEYEDKKNSDVKVEESVEKKEDLTPKKNKKYTYLNSVENITIDDVKIITYYYLDKEVLSVYDEIQNIYLDKEMYILRGETFINNVLLGSTNVLEIMDEPIEVVLEEHFSNHEVLYFKDKVNDNKYFLVRISNNNSLIKNGSYIKPITELTEYDDIDGTITYLVDKDGKIFKEFKYSSCYLAGIAVKQDEVEDRFYIEDYVSVFDNTTGERVEEFSSIIYPSGRYFDHYEDYFFWLDRINGNVEYMYYMEDGNLVEKLVKIYDSENYTILDVNCS